MLRCQSSRVSDPMEMILNPAANENAELIAAEAVEKLARSLGFSAEAIESLRLALIEACLNAAEHGGGEMIVRIATDPDSRLRIEVEDHGPGFDPEQPDPHPASRKHGCVEKRGWGLRLIREMMDEVSIDSRPGRTIIRMRKEIPDGGQELKDE